jgi:hypothetical protein
MLMWGNEIYLTKETQSSFTLVRWKRMHVVFDFHSALFYSNNRPFSVRHGRSAYNTRD